MLKEKINKTTLEDKWQNYRNICSTITKSKECCWMFLYPNHFTVIQACKCIWQYFINLSKESVHNVDARNSFSAVFILVFKNLNSAVDISSYDSAWPLSSDYTLKPLGMGSSMVQEELKSFKSQISQHLNNSNFCAGFQWRKWEYTLFTTLLHEQF